MHIFFKSPESIILSPSDVEKDVTIQVSRLLSVYALAISQMAALNHSSSLSIMNFLALHENTLASCIGNRDSAGSFLDITIALEQVTSFDNWYSLA